MSTSLFNLDNFTSEINIGFPVPITAEQYKLAQRQAQQHEPPMKQQRVLHHLLAVQAVEKYCQNMDIVTDREASYSFDLIHQTTNDVADLMLPNLGRLECRAVSEVCPLWTDGLGVVVVQWEEPTQTIHLLGFLPHTHLDQNPDEPLRQAASLEQLFVTIEQIELERLELMADPVIERVEARLQGRSLTEMVLLLERVWEDPSPRLREARLTEFLRGSDDLEIDEASEDLAMSGSMLSSPDAVSDLSALDRECTDLAETLLELFEDWQDTI